MRSRANVPFPRRHSVTTALSALSSPPPLPFPIPPMASASATASASPGPLDLAQRVDLDAVRRLVSFVNRHLRRFLADAAARKDLQMRCGRKIAVSHHAFFEFSEHSVLSNLYWGIENIEVALQSRAGSEERARRLAASEKMLQMPALLGEEGSTAGVENRYLVCCAYFYLAIARKLRGDEWQMIMHLLQALLVSPNCVRGELAPGLWRSLFGSLNGRGGSDEEVEEIARQHVRRYKDWLMYYQVVSYGENPPWTKECSDDDCGDRGAENYDYARCASARCFDSLKRVPSWLNFQGANLVHPLSVKDTTDAKSKSITSISDERGHLVQEGTEENSTLPNLDLCFSGGIKESFDIRCLQEMLEETQSDSPASFYSHIDSSEEESDSEERTQKAEFSADILSMRLGALASNTGERSCLTQSSHSELVSTSALESPGYPADKEDSEANASCISSTRSQSFLYHSKLSVLGVKEAEVYPSCNYYVKEGPSPVRSPKNDLRCFSTFSYRLQKKYNLSEFVSRGSFARRRKNYPTSEKGWSDESSINGKDNQVKILGIFEKAVATICFPEDRGHSEDVELEVTAAWELLKKQKLVKQSSTKQQILDQLMEIISASKTEKIIKESVSILLLLIAEDKTIIQDIKKKDSHLSYLASALKRNVHEAAILIYLLNPSPSEIRSLELLPALVEVACSSDSHNESLALQLTPSSASIAIIEILVTAFDYVTNNMHLATISSPQILSKLLNVAMHKNLEEGVALAAILVRCMRLNGNCKKFLSQFTPVEPFLHLLRSKEKRAKFAALEYFHEILLIPRSSAIRLLHQIRQQRSITIMHSLMACIQQTELDHQLMAANILFQLDILEGSSSKSVFKEEAMEVLMEAIANGKNSRSQILAACILSNIGGTYSWTGEPYTTPWMLKRAGLASSYSRNMIKDIDWLDPCLQDIEINAWSAKAARSIIKMGGLVFDALAKGMQSKVKIVSHDCLAFLAWLGSEIAILGPSNLKHCICETLLNEIAQFLHPGSDLEDRILSCICVYNYTSGKGKQKLMNFSEGIRESLRRLSSFTWMAEELLRVTDYFLPTKPRVSCVHTQILEVGQVGYGAATALIFFKGRLCVGHSDGSIRVWDIKGQKSVLLWEVREHKRTVTCFTLSESGDSVLSGSSDKTVRLWKMAQRKLECIEVIEMKEPIQKLETYGDKILVITPGHGLKVCHTSTIIQTLCKNKRIKCVVVAREKVYLGCSDSSIQEVDLMDGNKTTIRAPDNSWRINKKPINSIKLYRDWVYSAGAAVEGSCMKDWRKYRQPQISIPMMRRVNVQAMEVVEDFIYLNCSSSKSAVQIWLRGQQQKVGRLSAGCKVTSLLAANDIIFCGTETGFIKGWIPL